MRRHPGGDAARCEADRLNIAGLKLEAIAALSGRKTYSVFRRRFAAACGLPPSGWRAARHPS